MKAGHRWLVAVVALSLAAAACGDDDGSDASSSDTTATPATSVETSASAPEIDTGAVVKVAFNFVQGFSFDPRQSTASSDGIIQTLVYGSLLRKTMDGDYEPHLAESATIVDPQTVEVELRPDLVFSDGTTLDAAAVKASIEAIIASENPRAFRTEIQEVDRIDVAGPTSLTIHLARPIAGAFYDLLAFLETFPMGPGSTAEKPVGAGPFMVESYTPEARAVLVKNPRYFAADEIRVAGVEFVQAAEGPPQVNALRSGAVDAAPVAAESVAALQGSGVQTDMRSSDNTFLWFQVCKSAAPFDDVRVRQALNYALDREAMTATLGGGGGEPMEGFWTKGSRYFRSENEGLYSHDVERAKALLAEAGQSNLSFDVLVNTPTSQRFAEISQQMWAEAGITANLVTTSNLLEDFFEAKKAPMAPILLNRTGVDKVARVLVPGVRGNICDYDDPEINQPVERLRAVDQTSDEAVELWHELQRDAFEKAVNVFGIFMPQAYAWSDRLEGVEFMPDVFGRMHLDLTKVYVPA